MSPTTAPVYCAGLVHRQIRQPQELDPRAVHGPTAIGLMEEGQSYCTSCAIEIFRQPRANYDLRRAG